MTGNHRSDHRPTPIWNRPGLEQLAYRIGDYRSFKQRLLAALSTALKPPVGLPGDSPLANLTTRDDTDPAIALLDTWAVVADVLTFYQERIANEGYWRTATERLSILELARAIGYELDPGVAASTYLSFQVEDAPGSPTVVPIPVRTQIMSVPLKDELPQIFETIEPFTAYLEWNGLRPRATRPQRIYPHTRQLYLAGTSTQLRAGDLLLLVDNVPDRTTYLLPLHTVTPSTTEDYTLVQWRQSIPPIDIPLRRPQLFAFRLQAHLFGYNAPNWETMPSAVKLAAIEKGGSTNQGGVFRSSSDGLLWTPANQGLPDSDILCLVARDNLILAGTPNKGLFRSTNNGQTWEAANEGMTSLNILALHLADKETVFNEAIFAGTPNGGIFRSKDQGKNWVAINQGTVRSRQISNNEWEPINTSLPNTVVRSLLTYKSEVNGSIGTFRSEGRTVTADNIPPTTRVNQVLKINDVVSVTIGSSEQRRRVINNPNENSFEIDEPFIIENLPDGNRFSARITVNFNIDGVAQSETTEISSGTITSSGNQVRGNGTNFRELLNVVDAVSSREGVSNVEIANLEIEVAGQTLPIARDEDGRYRIEPSEQLVTDGAFIRNNLDPGTQIFKVIETNYIVAGTDQGIYRTTDQEDNDQGRNWYLRENTNGRTIFALVHISGNRVVAGTDDGVLTSNDNGASWGREWDSNSFSNRTILSLNHFGTLLFAGTERGIHRYNIVDSNWANISHDGESSLASLANRVITALATYERGGTRYLFAATDDGIFVSQNSSDAAETVTWQPISQDLVPQATTALAIDAGSKMVFAGTQFSGFFPAKPEPASDSSSTPIPTENFRSQKREWPDFVIQDPRQLDLDTLYPQILPESWIVLIDDRNPQDPEQQAEPRYAVRQVPSIVPIDRQDFGLIGKISRLELDVAVESDQYGLRSARLLGQSSELTLALEPLTVTDRQHDIFADPMTKDTVYLQTFVQNLKANQVVMVSGKPMRMQLADVGGVLRSRHDWQSRNTGLNDLTINALIADQAALINAPSTDPAVPTTNQTQALLAATNEGLYYSHNSGQSWTPFTQLRFKTIHSLHQSGTILWVGAELGLYQFNGDTESWISINTPADHTILSFLTYDFLIADQSNIWTIESISGITLNVSRTAVDALKPFGDGLIITADENHQLLEFWQQASLNIQNLIAQTNAAGLDTTSLEEYLNWTTLIIANHLANRQTRIVTTIIDENGKRQLLINRILDSNLPAPLNFAIGGTIWFAGTDRGFFRSTDRGQTWEYLLGLRDHQIYTMLHRRLSGLEEIFAGTDQGLCYSKDSGQSWESLENRWGVRKPLVVHTLAKRADADDIWIGTGQGIYRLGANVSTKPRKLNGLCDRTILSLQFQSDILYAGTDQGIYRSTNQGKTWEALDAGLSPSTGRALLVQTDRLLVGTEQGIFETPAHGQRVDPINWSRSNPGIVNAQILSLAHRADATTILAGTTAGLYRSTSGGRTWVPFDDNLDQANAPGKLRIQVVLNAVVNAPNGETDLSDRWFVGTPDGVFVYAALPDQPDTDRWQLVGSDTLPYPDIRAMAVQDSWLLVGTINGGLFKLNLDNLQPTARGKTPAEQRWQPTGLNNTNVQAIAVNSSAIYVGTSGDGIYRSVDGGIIWEQITEQRFGRGTLVSEGNQVTWSGFDPTDLLQQGDQITAAGQTRTILEIPDSAKPGTFIVNEPFRPNLLTSTAFTIYTGLTNQDITDLQSVEDQRDIVLTPSSNGDLLTFTVKQEDSETVEAIRALTNFLTPGSIIRATQAQQVEKRQVMSVKLMQANQSPTPSEEPDISLLIQLNRPFSFNAPQDVNDPQDVKYDAIRLLTLYAGTAGSGVFRSDDGGNHWQQSITNLNDLSIRCLLCEGSDTVWAGTKTAGVFRSTNRGDLWTPASYNLTNTDVHALLQPHQSTLLVGGIGILKSADGLTTKAIQRHDLVHVVNPPQPLAQSSVPLSSQSAPPSLSQPSDSHTAAQRDPQLPPPPKDDRWLLRDKDDFVGLLDTTIEQIFPLLPATEDDALVSEQAQIKSPPTDQQLPILTLQKPITHSYDPATVTIAANVVKATHGETAEEILGSGDGTTANQSFALRKPPLTYVPAANASGSDSTLEVRVDDVLWNEVSSLYTLKPHDQAYIIRIGDDGTTTVTFGNGVRGARLPSGQENITVRYRSGIGTDGNVEADRLSILKTRPQGIAKVTNSRSATGAANRESLEAARTNAPPTARTLGRIVSLQDFQDFAQGFAGIGKAQAVELWDGNSQIVHITIAGAEGDPVPETAALYQSLVAAIAAARDPLQQVQVESYERLFFNLEAKVLLNPRYQTTIVEPALIAVLTQTFAFERRAFGQAIAAAEVIQALQSVDGVVAVDLDALYIVGRSRALTSTLTAETARYHPDTDTTQPAQLFLLSPVGIQLTFVSTL